MSLEGISNANVCGNASFVHIMEASGSCDGAFFLKNVDIFVDVSSTDTAEDTGSTATFLSLIEMPSSLLYLGFRADDED